MKVGLQAWYNAWREKYQGSDHLYVARRQDGSVWSHQIEFVRDTLAKLFWGDVKYDDIPCEPEPCPRHKVTAWVIGEHLSKSVMWPVYSLERPDLGLQFVLRDNLYNWNVSVVAERGIVTDLRGFQLDFSDSDRKRIADRAVSSHLPPWQEGDSWSYLFFEGFPDEYRFGPFARNPRRFSIEIGTDYKLYTFMWLILRDWRCR